MFSPSPEQKKLKRDTVVLFIGEHIHVSQDLSIERIPTEI